MKNKKQLLILALLISVFFYSCNLISNTIKYKNTTKEFANDLLNKDYDKCIGLMATDNAAAKNINLDTLKKALENFRDIIVTNFGDHLDYTFIKTDKTFSTDSAERTPPNTTVVLMQFQNNKEFGVFEVLFDDVSKKIIHINTLQVKEPIPGMIIFWLFGIVAICVPVFNIYMIVKIKRSTLKKKWLFYLAIILLNIPAITYNAIGGLSIAYLDFQILFGISFSYMGYFYSAWSFGIPLGSFYTLWRLSKKRGEMTTAEIMPEEQSPDNDKPIDTRPSI